MVEWGREKVLGNYFIALIHTEGEWHWSLIPFILIWVGFGVLLLVREQTAPVYLH